MRHFILSLVFLVAGCGTARTVVLEPAENTRQFASVRVEAHQPTVDVPVEATEKIESVIRKGLYEQGAFVEGDELVIEYTFVSHDPGDRFARWFWAGIGNAGEGSLTVLVRYSDRQGAELARTQVEGRIGSGFFGGSIDEAITKAGEDIVEFTIKNFVARM